MGWRESAGRGGRWRPGLCGTLLLEGLLAGQTPWCRRPVWCVGHVKGKRHTKGWAKGVCHAVTDVPTSVNLATGRLLWCEFSLCMREAAAWLFHPAVRVETGPQILPLQLPARLLLLLWETGCSGGSHRVCGPQTRDCTVTSLRLFQGGKRSIWNDVTCSFVQKMIWLASKRMLIYYFNFFVGASLPDHIYRHWETSSAPTAVVDVARGSKPTGNALDVPG